MHWVIIWPLKHLTLAVLVFLCRDIWPDLTCSNHEKGRVTCVLFVKIEKLMNQHECTIQWPRTRKESLMLHCTIDASQPDAVFTMLDWHKRSYDAMREELGCIRCGKFDVSSQVWKQLKEAMRKVVNFGTDKMLVHWDDNTSTVYFSGLCSAVDQFEREVSKITAGLEDELRKKTEQVTETFQLKPYQRSLLDIKDFARTSSSAKCTVTISKDEAVFVGEAAEVMTVRRDMLRLLSGVASRTIDQKSSAFVTVLGKEQIRKRITQSLLKKKVFATYDIQDEDANVYSFSDKEAAEASKIIKAEVVEKKFVISASDRACLTSSEWQQFQLDIGKLGKPAAVCQEGSSIVAVTVAEEMEGLESKVSNFIESNTVKKEFISMPVGVVEVLQKYATAEVDQIKRSFNHHAADIRFVSNASQNGCEIIATSSGIRQVIDAIKALEMKVKSKDHNVESPMYVKFLQAPATRATIDGIAGRNQVSVKFPDETKVGIGSSKLPSPNPVCEVLVGRSKTIRLVTGDITQHSVDVIVNAANPRLQHGAGVAGAISRVGMGYSLYLLSECESILYCFDTECWLVSRNGIHHVKKTICTFQMTCGSCLSGKHIITWAIGVSWPLVFGCGMILHPEYGNWDCPSIPSDEL